MFEAAAYETPLVSDSWEGLEGFFEPGKEILVASTAADVVDALAVDSEDLHQMGRAARERILSEHTAEHRGQQLIRFLEAA